MNVCITGATGFIGSALLRQLLDREMSVRLLVRPGNNRKNIDGLKVQLCEGGLEDEDSLARVLEGCQQLYHVAAHYSLWTPLPRIPYRVNVEGTENLFRAAALAGVERIVYTSTVGALGLPSDGSPGDEETPVNLTDMVGHYKRSKFLAEQLVLRMAREEKLPVVIVNPSAPVGPRDVKPTPTGQMILDFLKGKMWAYLDTGMNVVDVEDVALGHILAMEKGRIGEKYILGHQNMTLEDIFKVLGRISGIRPPRYKAPYALAYVAAVFSEGMANWVTKRPPRVPKVGVKMAKKQMYFSPAKAVRELGLPQTPIETALEKAVQWFVDQEYVKRLA